MMPPAAAPPSAPMPVAFSRVLKGCEQPASVTSSATAIVAVKGLFMNPP
jgi:hypothetical protein